MAQAIEATPGDLRGRAEGIAGCRHGAELTRIRTQHAFTEKLLGAVPPARQ